ncbi:MAG TPA: hypothetical protein VHN74_04730 [Candidatus Angelobacter sp.]|jgi:hypothetical protein|nr:hypothetical protein [Candidatus Angelobacter sp.]
MREVDPIRNPSEALLSSALHRLAAGSSKGAPDELGGLLRTEFRRHHRARRQKRMAVISSIAACIIVVMLFVSGKISIRQSERSPAPQTQAARPSPPPALPETNPAPSPSRRASNERNSAATISNTGDPGFVTLSPYDSAVSAADLTIVRVELTGTDLRLLGAPVTEDLSDQRLLADVVVSGDGTPYAVRIVR